MVQPNPILAEISHFDERASRVAGDRKPKLYGAQFYGVGGPAECLGDFFRHFTGDKLVP
jgi:hypothetical protein